MQFVGLALVKSSLLQFNFTRAQKGATVVSLMVLEALLYGAYLTSPNSDDGWRSAFEFVEATDPEEECLLLFYPGFIESQTPSWHRDKNFGDFIRSPFSYYQINRKHLLLPYTFDKPDAKKYLQAEVLPAIETNRCVALLYRNREL